MLGHQLPKPAPSLHQTYGPRSCRCLRLAYPARADAPLQRDRTQDLDPTWTAPRAITSWRRGFPLELIRYAGANRLKVELNYQAENGRWGPHVVEPYSLRYTKDGNLLLFVINDYGALRSYRVDESLALDRPQRRSNPRCWWSSDQPS